MDSMQKLGLDYVDCFLVHWPVAAERTADYQPRIGTDGKVCSHISRCGSIYAEN
jgi:diketogulonate reductase-like aldo/keto reductase